MPARPRILVLGGGYVPITLTRELRRPIEQNQVDLTIVSRENFQAFHGFVGEMITGRIGAANMLSPARRVFAPAKVHVAEIESINLAERRVHTSRHLDGGRFELEYDQLVLALGSAENLEAYPGLAEHAYRLKTFQDCFRLKNHLVDMFELADIETDRVERRRLLTFFVAGGGYAGTEIAGELADFVRLLTKREYAGIRRDECRVVLVTPGPTILPELYGSSNVEHRGRSYQQLVEYATRHARKLGVELMTETRVVGATPNEVYLSNGPPVPTRTIVSTVGTKPPPILEGMPLPRDESGRLVTDRSLRVEGYSDVWAGGDNASVPYPKGGTCPPVGIYALKHGLQIGRNLKLVLAGRSPQPFTYTGLGQGVSIGKRTAVGELKGHPISGTPAWLVWRGMLFYFFPTWDRRLRLLADWAIWPLVGRDIVEMGREQAGDYEVRHNVYQPGEVIADKSRPVRYVHVIVEGHVELVRGGDGSGEPEAIDTIGPGGHFGRKWLEQTAADAVRAKSVVRTVALRADQANRLQDVLVSAGRLIAKTGIFPTITDEERERLRRKD